MEQNGTSQQEWFKSSLSAAGNCVEVMHTPDGMTLRNSTSPHGPVMNFTRDEWDAFIGGAKLGEFDRPAAG